MDRESSVDQQMVVKILEWPVPAGWSDFADRRTPKEKIQLRVELAKKLKNPVLEHLRSYRDVEIISEMDGTVQAIVAASAIRWKSFAENGAEQLFGQDVTIHDNVIIPGAHLPGRAAEHAVNA